MAEVQLKAKACKCCTPFTNKTAQYKQTQTTQTKQKYDPTKHDKKEYNKVIGYVSYNKALKSMYV